MRSSQLSRCRSLFAGALALALPAAAAPEGKPVDGFAGFEGVWKVYYSVIETTEQTPSFAVRTCPSELVRPDPATLAFSCDVALTSGEVRKLEIVVRATPEGGYTATVRRDDATLFDRIALVEKPSGREGMLLYSAETGASDEPGGAARLVELRRSATMLSVVVSADQVRYTLQADREHRE